GGAGRQGRGAPAGVVHLRGRREPGAGRGREAGTRRAGPAGVDDALSAAAILQRLLPPEVASLFDASFLRMHLLYDEFIYRLVLQTAAETGLEAATREPGTGEGVAVPAGVGGPRAPGPPDWVVGVLAGRGLGEGPPRRRA